MKGINGDYTLGFCPFSSVGSLPRHCSQEQPLPHQTMLSHPHPFLPLIIDTDTGAQWKATTMFRELKHRRHESLRVRPAWRRDSSRDSSLLSTLRGCRDPAARLFSEVHSERTRSNGQKLEKGKIILDTRKNLPGLVEHALSRRLDQMTTRGPFQPKFLYADKQAQCATTEGK